MASPKQKKEFIKKTLGLSERAYKARMTNLQKRVELYNKAYGLKGAQKVRASEVFYGQAKAKEIYGSEYFKSSKMKTLESISPRGGVRLARAQLSKSLQNSFEGLEQVNKQAAAVLRALRLGKISTAEARAILDDIAREARWRSVNSDEVEVTLSEEMMQKIGWKPSKKKES